MQLIKGSFESVECMTFLLLDMHFYLFCASLHFFYASLSYHVVCWLNFFFRDCIYFHDYTFVSFMYVSYTSSYKWSYSSIFVTTSLFCSSSHLKSLFILWMFELSHLMFNWIWSFFFEEGLNDVYDTILKSCKIGITLVQMVDQ